MRLSGKRAYYGFAVVLLLAGLIGGLTLSSKLGLMYEGDAGSSPVKVEAPPVLMELSNGLADVAEAVIPTVVNISTTKTVKQENPMAPFYDDPFFRRFFGDPYGGGRQWEYRQKSLGSGVIVSPEGYILTNNHVVEGAEDIRVTLSDKLEFKGELVGNDPRSDVAVIKIDASDLPSVAWADSDSLRPGEMVMAVGSPFGLSRTVTVGIVSAVGRANVGITDYEDFIQTDAAINPGNSGGALVNLRGELVGINTAIFSRSGGYQGIGFAVPSNMARQVMDSLIKEGKVNRGWLGVSVQDLTPQLAKQFGTEGVSGALVAEVVKDSPAEKGGLKMGDIITSVDGKKVTDSGHLRNVVAAVGVGQKVMLGILRDGKEMELDVTLGELPVQAAGPAGEVEVGDSALAGVVVKDFTPELREQLGLDKGVSGVVVFSVDQASQAADAGLAKGDVIQSINRVPVASTAAYKNQVAALGAKGTALLLVNRKGSLFWMTVSPKG